jgi:predicted ATP-dependent Lon-type protease
MNDFRIKRISEDESIIQKKENLFGVCYWSLYEEEYWYAHSKTTYKSIEECLEKLKKLNIPNDKISIAP